MPSKDVMSINVQVQGRPDGGLRVTSKDEPGLLMSHRDAAWLWPKVGPTLKRLLEGNQGLAVESVDYPEGYPEGRGPHDVGMKVTTFTVHLRRAA